MNSVSLQISQYLAQPDLNPSRRKALNYLNDSQPFSQPTSSLEDALQRIRHERDSLRISVRNNRRVSGYFLSTFPCSDGCFKLEHRETEV
jgi:hypothetical protein